MNKILVSLSAVVLSLPIVACDPGTDSYDGPPDDITNRIAEVGLRGISNASLSGSIGEVAPVSGPATSVDAVSWTDEPGIDNVMLEHAKGDGVAMLIVDSFEGIVRDGTEGRRIIVSGREARIRVQESIDQAYENGLGSEVEDIEIVRGRGTFAMECSGPESDTMDFDEPLDNVIVDVRDCVGCEEDGAKEVDIIAWNDGEEEPINGEFEWRPEPL